MRAAAALPLLFAATLLPSEAIPGAWFPGAPALAAQEMSRPAGWKVRFDRANATEADLETFVDMPPGWHITTGPAAIFWEPDRVASGDFKAEAEIFLFDPMGRREAFGIFVGGRDLEGPNQRYTYFLIRDGGEFLIKTRSGSETSTLMPWTPNEAILSFADRGSETTVRNVLSVEAKGDSVRFAVNGKTVAKLPRQEVDSDGVVGLRVNHRLNLHISRLDVTPKG
ncbi:MAG: hypothetical protein ACE5GJ_00840 [Gemmatimonadota bacterium]